MSTQESTAVAQAFGEAINSGNLDAFEQLVAPNCVDHDPAPRQVPGPAGYKCFFGDMRTAFPDMHVDFEQLVADGDIVVFAYSLTGTHQGPLMGHQATGKSIKVRGMQISRFDDGKMVERWGSSDELGMLAQLGLGAL